MREPLSPIVFSWSNEWLPRIQERKVRLRVAMQAAPAGEQAQVALRVTSEWTREVDAWLTALETRKQRDVVQLLKAEAAMLYELIDPSEGPKPQNGDPASTEFRERYYDAMALARAAERIGLPDYDGAMQALREVERFAEKKVWLP